MKKCVVCGRECKNLFKGMCHKHYTQCKKYGKSIDNNPRTVYDPNEIVEYEDHAEIIIYNKQCEEIARALIDLEDVDNAKCYKWSMNAEGYVQNVSKNIKLHRLIMNPDDDMVIDHINHNTLDNRKSNLRICTKQQNNINRKVRSNNKSGITGVFFDKQSNKWKAQIQINSTKIHLGYFDTKEEAAERREQAELEYFGDYRNDNKDDE